MAISHQWNVGLFHFLFFFCRQVIHVVITKKYCCVWWIHHNAGKHVTCHFFSAYFLVCWKYINVASLRMLTFHAELFPPTCPQSAKALEAPYCTPGQCCNLPVSLPPLGPWGYMYGAGVILLLAWSHDVVHVWWWWNRILCLLVGAIELK